MKKEDPFENIDTCTAVRTDEVEGKVTSNPSPSPQVLKRVFHSRTEMLIYPNGQVYPGKTSSWFEDKVYQHKKKAPKSKAKTKKSQLTVEESY